MEGSESPPIDIHYCSAFQSPIATIVTLIVPFKVLVLVLISNSNLNSISDIDIPSSHRQQQVQNANNTHTDTPIMTDEAQLINGVAQLSLDEILGSSNPANSKMNKKEKALAWGRPGHLTQQELDIYVSVFGAGISRICSVL